MESTGSSSKKEPKTKVGIEIVCGIGKIKCFFGLVRSIQGPARIRHEVIGKTTYLKKEEQTLTHLKNFLSNKNGIFSKLARYSHRPNVLGILGIESRNESRLLTELTPIAGSKTMSVALVGSFRS